MQMQSDANPNSWQTKEMGCFVAGTLVHTREALRPIEQIKVGDYVLSKPESGEGETSYQRVTRTYEYEDREVYLVWWQVLDVTTNKETKEWGYVVLTGDHPLWMEGIKDDEPEQDNQQQPLQRFAEINAWLSVEALYKLRWEAIWLRDEYDVQYPIVQLADGRKASLQFFNPILQGPEIDVGVMFGDYPETWRENQSGDRIEFSFDGPRMPRDERGRLVEVCLGNVDPPMPNADPNVSDAFAITDRSGGFPPIRRTVFNIEVENTHTYFVGETGLWVHDISGLEKIQM